VYKHDEIYWKKEKVAEMWHDREMQRRPNYVMIGRKSDGEWWLGVEFAHESAPQKAI